MSKKNYRLRFAMFLLLAGMLWTTGARADAFRDIKVVLANGNLLTDEEKSSGSTLSFGIAVAEDGTISRVASDATDARAVLSGKYHSDQHGWTNFSATVPVDGAVKITFGTCAWGGDVNVKNAAGETVTTFNTNTGACYDANTGNNVISAYYKGTDATTLTISGGAYVPYFAVESVDASDIPSDVKITFQLGSDQPEGTLPAEETAETGKEYTLPLNRTLYLEGKTLTAWTDEAGNSYTPGQTITVPADNLTLTAVFTDNKVALTDRTDDVKVTFDFQRKNGAPLLSYQGKKGIYVAQATVNGESIDVKTDFDTTNGKLANGNWQDWAQINGGPIFTIPSCKGATVSMEAYSSITTTTIDGQTDYAQGTTISYEIASSAETIDVVIGDGSYYRYISVLLPYIENQGGGTTFDNAEANIIWDFNSSSTVAPSTVTPEGGFTLTTVSVGDQLTESSAGYDGTYYVTFQPAAQMSSASEGHNVSWNVTPSKGLTFTPTHVQANIRRFGTDGGLIDIVATNEEGVSETLATGIVPRRNKTADQDKLADTAVESFSLDIPATLATKGQFTVSAYIYSLGSSKTVGFNDVRISGTLNGTTEDVQKYNLAIAANPEEGGSVSMYPTGGTYDAGTEITLTATKNFGYAFVSWTDASGNVVSEDAKFKYTLEGDQTLTANFQKVNTYSLNVTVEEPANDYMVQYNPEPTVVDGKYMYEEGTKVTLTALANHILTFTGWSNGETAGEIIVPMPADPDLTASYSAIDFIAGWDFWLSGSSSRVADFAAADNDVDQLVLRNEDGDIQGWLDKCYSAGGYEGKEAAAVNWRAGSENGDVGNYYWQTKVNAAAFTDIVVYSEMCYNYNAYQKQDIQYSLDGENWTTAGSINISGVKNWTAGEIALPAECNNQSELYIRWKSDKTSSIDGTSSKNDGISIANIYILGTEKLVNDGTAPVLVSTTPAEGATTASANGKVVLTFDEKVKIADGATATLDGKELQPAVSGKNIIFEYAGLEYSTEYTFTLPANVVSDLTDNFVTSPIVVNFSTKSKPTVDKGNFDFIVPDDGTVAEAFAEAAKRTDTSKRFRIFVKAGTWQIPASETTTVKGSDGVDYANPTTYVGTPNISLIGEEMDETIILNTPPQNLVGGACPIEGLTKCDVIQLNSKAKNTYMQDITIKNNTADATGRNVALTDESDKTICKDVCLYGYQDTYYSRGGGRYYFEGGRLRGRTDFLCGGSDVFYNGVELVMCEKGGYITAAATPKKYGYVFRDCVIKGENAEVNSNFTLGRPWSQGACRVSFINTTMEAQPSAIGWSEMSGGYPTQLAEYNSMTSSGTAIDLSQRKTSFGDNHPNNPVLTAEQAAEMTIENVMGGDDNWDPTAATEQASAPENVLLDGNTLTWDNNNYVLCWAVCKDGRVVDFTTEPTYTVDDATATWSVRAANEMGGLGDATQASDATAIQSLQNGNSRVVKTDYYTTDGIQLQRPQRGVNIVVKTLENGEKQTSKLTLK